MSQLPGLVPRKKVSENKTNIMTQWNQNALSRILLDLIKHREIASFKNYLYMWKALTTLNVVVAEVVYCKAVLPK